jgi:hypothetical protein
MKNAVLVAPYFMDATERFIAAAAIVPHARIGLVSCDTLDRLPADLRARLAGHYRVDGIALPQLREGVEGVGRQWGSIDRILGVLEQIQVPLGELRDQLGVSGMGAAAARNFRDKSLMKTVLQQHGLPCARHQLVVDCHAGSEFAGLVGFPIIVKPPDGAGAKSTFRCENMQHLSECLVRLRPSPDNPMLLEEFITGKEHSFDSVIIDGRVVWHSISHYYPAPLEVVRQPWIQWCVLIPCETDVPDYAGIRAVAEPSLRALGMRTGLSHMEWFRRSDGSVAISEIGARPPGAQFMTLMSYAHDIDMYRAWSRLMIHDQFQPPPKKYACGAAYLRGMGTGRVAHVHGLAQIARELGDIVVKAKIPDIGQASSGTYEGEGFIIVRHPETHVVENALRQIITQVQVQLAS